MYENEKNTTLYELEKTMENMLKRYYIFICMVMLFFTFASCKSEPAHILPLKQPDGTFLWNGLQLVFEETDLYGDSPLYGFAVFDNVIATKDKTLAVVIKNTSSDPIEYGFNEFLQVELNSIWYTLPYQLSQNEEPLVLAGLTSETKRGPGIEHMVDFSAIGELPPGKYRLIEEFYWERRRQTNYSFAYFWVIEPGGKLPHEAETTGKAHKEDIVFYIESLYEARRNVTDRDIWFGAYVENLSGKKYAIDHEEEKNPPILEIKQNGKWKTIAYKHINAGMIVGWSGGANAVFLDEPLAAGHYRMRLPIYAFEYPDDIIELAYEFDVIAHEAAPEPNWDISRLKLSKYEKTRQSTGVVMSFVDPVLNKNNTKLEMIVTVDDNVYTYGASYEVEVLLEGRWYQVPFGGSGGFSLVAQNIGPNAETHEVCDPVHGCGVLPKGRYRIIKDFEIQQYPPDESQERVVSDKEYVMAEFEVAETLSGEEFFLDMWKNVD